VSDLIFVVLTVALVAAIAATLSPLARYLDESPRPDADASAPDPATERTTR
jgi:hypothetical protein